ncbi:glutathione peroxidase [Actinomycetaceae bacterium WB03_NA08]|uniref:Glutathione peroxidase n=1 Tax=Scrofimicrobium canadense TaxID=2652290 RepID=A0A6N7W708_9ACTO|nr:glutathione peroxidase [Scrofimicrobium canadense]MSS85035.1 glutathione peroxidase [Scrofimicrobium canadense]
MDLNDIQVPLLDGTETTFGDLVERKVALVVNVASRCGLTPQYEQLEALHRRFGGRGFTVIGVPSNQFLQEPGSEGGIATYCSTTWGTTFPMTAKMKLNGKHADALYKELTQIPDVNGKAGRVKWNFEKFLLGPQGERARFRPTTKPDDPAIVQLIEEWLPEKS